ncbi:MAG TPA: exodeoxyribonuclease VII small subunit [Candidatus Limnocylindrales bacterium]|nr:exodeoxyribonuclease VII small subunit [Candidatus Limnocylindrales bacterium]
MSQPTERPSRVTLERPDTSSARQRIEALAFDAAMAELQAVVGRLEAGNLPLEESIDLYEQGVLLHERCSRLLSEAELRLQRLVEGPGGRLRTLDLSVDDGESDR